LALERMTSVEGRESQRRNGGRWSRRVGHKRLAKHLVQVTRFEVRAEVGEGCLFGGIEAERYRYYAGHDGGTESKANGQNAK
jgi:hypothetical protein